MLSIRREKIKDTEITTNNFNLILKISELKINETARVGKMCEHKKQRLRVKLNALDDGLELALGGPRISKRNFNVQLLSDGGHEFLKVDELLMLLLSTLDET